MNGWQGLGDSPEDTPGYRQFLSYCGKRDKSCNPVDKFGRHNLSLAGANGAADVNQITVWAAWHGWHAGCNQKGRAATHQG